LFGAKLEEVKHSTLFCKEIEISLSSRILEIQNQIDTLKILLDKKRQERKFLAMKLLR